MERFSLLPLSLFIALNAGANDKLALTLSDIQPMRADTHAGSPTEESRKATVSTSEKSIYIVQLQEPSVARYEGGIAGFKATSPRRTGELRLNVHSTESKSYSGFLRSQQKQARKNFERTIGRDVNVKFEYQHAFNGVAMELTADEAKALASQPEVKHITKERYERPMTDVGPQWIGADSIWGEEWYPPFFPHSQGENMVVAVMDTGVNHDHPSFADIGGDGYDHENPLGSGNYIPGSYCDTVDPSFCNDKMIGAWGLTAELGDPTSPEDTDGHGSHTASTAVGNVIPGATLHAPTTSLTRDISGVAPHANLIVYDVCVDTCPGSALLAAVEQVVIDSSALPNGIQAINYSISGGDNPYNDPVELGFLNATAAGIYVAASAGNEGPGASTTGHNSPWVANTAAMTHNRKLENSLTDMTSDGASLADVTSVGFTSGYGPASIVYAGDYPTANGSPNDTDPAQCLEPFPAGHFNGEIVICDRGAIARTAKGANVLAGGAGGFVLANTEAEGGSVVGDAHALPGVHVSYETGEVLKNWVATEENTVATISGAQLNLDYANGDIMAAFSSRGPNLAVDVVKPDIGGPGVSILAAIDSNGGPSPEYGLISGTSMSSPHHAGAAALMSAVRPDWSPYAIKSALMMTSKSYNNFKEDGVTPTDAFDVGAGRIDLTLAPYSGLVLNETPENFLAADPAKGGDPKTLNIASMQDSNCVGKCSWTRTVTNVTGHRASWKLKAKGPDGIDFKVKPRRISLRNGESREITISADTTLATEGWNFAELQLDRRGWGWGPDLHMPIAILPANSTNADVFNNTVDKKQAKRKDILNYELKITNGQLGGTIDLSNALPRPLKYVEDSATIEVTKGETLSPLTVENGEITWSGTLEVGELNLTESPAPFGYVPMSNFADPFGCPEDNCDDGGVILDVPSFKYNGQMYNQVIWSVNGTLQAGSEGGQAVSASTQHLPDTTPPNNLMAPFWADLNMGVNGDGAEWYVAVLNAGSDQYTVYEWNNIPLFGDSDTRYTFQIWIQNGDSGNIWFVYDRIDNPAPANGVSIGVENATGRVGASYFNNGTGTEPAAGTDLMVETLQGGSAVINFQAEVGRCKKRLNPIVNSAVISNGEITDTAIAVTECVRGR